MGSDDLPDDSDDPLLLKAVVAGLAALCAAALALGVADGVAPGRPRGAAPGPETALPVSGGRGPALPPVLRLCFRGPRGEPVDFPAMEQCSQAAAP